MFFLVTHWFPLRGFAKLLVTGCFVFLGILFIELCLLNLCKLKLISFHLKRIILIVFYVYACVFMYMYIGRGMGMCL